MDFINNNISSRMAGNFLGFEKGNSSSDKQSIKSSDNNVNNGNNRTAGTMPASEEDLDFKDFIDFINPLQHVPIVGTLYRSVTGDEIKEPVQIMGGALFGGGVGMLSSAAGSAIKNATGSNNSATESALLQEPKDNFKNNNLNEHKVIKYKDIQWNNDLSDQNLPLSINTSTQPTQMIDKGNVGAQGLITPDYPKTQLSFAKKEIYEDANNITSDGLKKIKLDGFQQTQDALGPLPPELIAQKMAFALEKYSAKP